MLLLVAPSISFLQAENTGSVIAGAAKQSKGKHEQNKTMVV
jgi:hypothetical protein